MEVSLRVIRSVVIRTQMNWVHRPNCWGILTSNISLLGLVRWGCRMETNWLLSNHNLIFLAGNIGWLSGDMVVNYTTRSFNLWPLTNLISMVPYDLSSTSSLPLFQQWIKFEGGRLLSHGTKEAIASDLMGTLAIVILNKSVFAAFYSWLK